MPRGMSLLGPKWNVPIMRPMWPFFAGGALVYYGVWKASDAMMDAEEWKNDPRNPKAKSGGH